MEGSVTDAERLEEIRLGHSPAISSHLCAEDSRFPCEQLFLLRLLDERDQEINFFKTEYQDEAGMSMMREQQGFLQAEIARLRAAVQSARGTSLEDAATAIPDNYLFSSYPDLQRSAQNAILVFQQYIRALRDADNQH